jgi:hypothetical protein
MAGSTSGCKVTLRQNNKTPNLPFASNHGASDAGKRSGPRLPGPAAGGTRPDLGQEILAGAAVIPQYVASAKADSSVLLFLGSALGPKC